LNLLLRRVGERRGKSKKGKKLKALKPQQQLRCEQQKSSSRASHSLALYPRLLSGGNAKIKLASVDLMNAGAFSVCFFK
jgi:hypothetical protein